MSAGVGAAAQVSNGTYCPELEAVQQLGGL